jgi:hypothetical protein
MPLVTLLRIDFMKSSSILILVMEPVSAPIATPATKPNKGIKNTTNRITIAEFRYYISDGFMI